MSRPKNPNPDELICRQMLVGFTKAQCSALEMVATSIGMPTSSYVRQIAIERLVAMKLLENPMDKYIQKTIAVSAEA